MSKLVTPLGVYKYKSKLLYPGVKRINRDIAKENLLLLQKLFKEIGIHFLLTYGTLLGVVREQDFIEHDEDIDLILKDEYRDKFLSSLFKLRKYGFELVRYDRRDLFSIMRKGEYIDLYFFKRTKLNFWMCSGIVVSDEFMREEESIMFADHLFATHSNYIGFLTCVYGSDWMTPIEYNNYEMTFNQRLKFRLKERIKQLLPDRLYYKFIIGPERKLTIKTLGKIVYYLQLKEKI